MILEIDLLKRQERALPEAAGVQDSSQRIENALRCMGAIMADDHIPLHVRDQVGLAHRQLHACRDELTVRRMEREKGLR